VLVSGTHTHTHTHTHRSCMVAFEKTTGEHLFNTGNPRNPTAPHPLLHPHDNRKSVPIHKASAAEGYQKKKPLPLPLGRKMMTVMSALCVSPGPQGGHVAHSAARDVAHTVRHELVSWYLVMGWGPASEWEVGCLATARHTRVLKTAPPLLEGEFFGKRPLSANPKPGAQSSPYGGVTLTRKEQACPPLAGRRAPGVGLEVSPQAKKKGPSIGVPRASGCPLGPVSLDKSRVAALAW